MSLSLPKSPQQILKLFYGVTSYLAILLFSLSSALGQEKNPQRGFQLGNSYALSDIETINTTNGNVLFHLPLGSLPAGRGGLTAGISLIYNSKLLDSELTYFRDEARPCETGSGDPPTSYTCPYFEKSLLKLSEEGGWRYAMGYGLKLIDRRGQYAGVPEGEQPQCLIYGGTPGPGYQEMINHWKLIVTFPDGSSHMMRPQGFTDTNGEDWQGDFYKVRPDGFIEDCAFGSWYTGTLTYYSTDGSYLRLDVQHDDNTGYWTDNPWTLYMGDGTRVTGGSSAPQRIYDRNNNYIEVTDNQIKDQFNRTVTLGNDGKDETITAQGFGEALVWKVRRKTIRIRKTYKGCISANCPYPNADPETFDETLEVVDRITLPDQAGGLSYTFSYNAPDYVFGSDPYSDGWGEVSGITLPSGAHVSYGFAQDGSFSSYTADVLRNSPGRKDLSYNQQYDGGTDPVTETWLYNIGSSDNPSSSITGPDGGGSTEYFFGSNPDSWNSGLVYKTIRSDGTLVERLWAKNSLANYGVLSVRGDNPYVKTEFTSIKNAAGAYVWTAIKDYSYDKNGNVTRVAEYDWVDYNSVYSQGTPAIPGGLHPARITNSGYYAETQAAEVVGCNNSNCYWQSSAPLLRSAAKSVAVSDGALNPTVFSRTELTYDNPLTTGNVTQTTSWDSTKGALNSSAPILTPGNSISVFNQYSTWTGGATGKLTQSTDARGTLTVFSYSSVGGFEIYPTQIQTAYGTAMRRTETLDYDFSTGLVTKVTDADNAVSTSTIYDAFGRPTLVRAAEGKPEESRTSVEYSDVARRVITRSDLNTLGDEKLVSIQHYDQLGRVRLTRQLEDSTTQSATDETTGIKVQTRYLFSGANSYRLASNPYRAATSTQAGGEQAMGWTRSKSDNGGRLIEVQTFPGAGLPAPWGGNSTGTGTMTTAYNANLTTVTDQTGKVRRSLTNGLGQLARVDEPDGNNNLDQSGFPSQPTSYTYDALSNLIRVNQGPQTRTFIYSSLGRLLSAQNPESGTISYQYDANGNVTRKTDARNIQTNYVYDALNRPTARSYSDSTPGITYSYDSATISNGKGRLVSASSSVSTYSYSGYDALGRVTGGSQTLGSQTYSMSYGYDRAGHITSMTYPSSRTVTNSYDGAGRANSVTGTLGDGASRTYATGITYSPLGGLKQEQFGTDTPIYNKQYYNSRGQLAEIRESTIPNNTSWNRGAIINHYSDQCWGVCAGQSMADNNGNLKKQDNYIPDNEQVSSYQTYTQFYSYDNLNRLQTVTESKYLNGSTTGTQTLSQGYGYDRFGNRTINTSQTWGGVNNLGFEVDTATNRLYSPGDLALPDGSRRMRYDDAGNQITDSYTGEGQRTYDAENRMTQAWSNGQWQSYTYDPNGQRVRRRVDGVETWQVYAIGGELLAEYAANASPGAPQKEYGYRNGQLLITAVPPTGSPSAQTNVALSSNGGTAVASSYFSNPSYGTFLPSSVNDGSRRALNNSIWLDNTYGVFPDWIEVDFNGNKTINEIDVITQQDDYQNPVEPTLTQTFTSWGITTFEVQYWNGGSWVTVPGGSVSGNNKVWRQFTFSNIITSKIRLFVNDSADHVYSRVVEVEAWTPSASGETTTYQASTNFASTQGQQNWYYLDSTGAQMTFNVGGYWQGPESYLWLWANGGHPGQNIDAVRQWRAPQSGTIRITGNVSDANTTCGDGVVVSIKKGAGVLWQQTIENGNTTGFSYDLTTSVTAGDQINFVINKRVTTNYCDGTNFDPAITLTGGGSSAGAAEINWLVSDQLGTPRMIFDKTGSLANIKRHDYLPFGEELFSGTGQRPTAQGYTGDSIRQKFTLKERDNETGLDYFGARYYGSTQGRFTSGDPASLALRHLVNPQDLNRYAYVANNPLKFIDPDGEEKIQVVIQTFIPQKSVTDPVQGRTFEGDGRNVGEPGGFRTQQIVNIETDPSRGAAQSGPFNGISGPSHELSGPGGRIIGEATASGETLEGRVTRSESGVVNIQAKGNEGNPLVSGAPGITYDFNIQVQSAGTQGNVTVTVTGSHDKFPAYEIMVIRPEVSKPSTTVVYQHDPRQTGNTALSLFPGNQKTINPPVRTVIPAPPAPAPPPQRRRGKRGEEE